VQKSNLTCPADVRFITLVYAGRQEPGINCKVVLPKKTPLSDVVLSGAPSSIAVDGNLILAFHMRLQQAQAQQMARQEKFENTLLQMLAFMKRNNKGRSSQQGLSETGSGSVTNQASRTKLMLVASETKLLLCSGLDSQCKL
jgi:hypothetical protein